MEICKTKFDVDVTVADLSKTQTVLLGRDAINACPLFKPLLAQIEKIITEGTTQCKQQLVNDSSYFKPKIKGPDPADGCTVTTIEANSVYARWKNTKVKWKDTKIRRIFTSNRIEASVFRVKRLKMVRSARLRNDVKPFIGTKSR